MKYNIRDKDLKKLGYKYQLELPLRRKTYTKKIGAYFITLYVAGSEIVIDDWGTNIRNMLTFFSQNRNDPKFDECILGTNRPKGYVRIQKNIFSGQVQFYDMAFYNECVTNGNREAWNERYGAFREFILYKKDMDSLLIEIENLLRYSLD